MKKKKKREKEYGHLFFWLEMIVEIVVKIIFTFDHEYYWVIGFWIDFVFLINIYFSVVNI